MTRARCVQTDAAAATVLALLTAIACAGCGAPEPQPIAASPPPLPLARVATLLVGLPAAGRSSLLFTCDAPPSAPRIGSATYAADLSDPDGRRWLRLAGEPSDSAGALAPDTLLVRAFDDAIDEEIALERGEVDVAVFWPGEVSARMRADARFREPELGLRARGALACVRAPGDTLGAPNPDMEMLNREAFAGDLLPWSELNPAPDDGPWARYTVDPTLPGARQLERILGRIRRAGVMRTLKLVYVDMPVALPSSDVQLPLEYPPHSGTSILGLFALRCPVLARAEGRAAVRLIGAHTFAELAPCASGTRP